MGACTGAPRRNLRATVTTRLSETERALIEIAAEEQSRRDGVRVTPSALIRQMVMPLVVERVNRAVGAAVLGGRTSTGA